MNLMDHIPFKESPFIYFTDQCEALRELSDNFDIIKKEFHSLAWYQRLGTKISLHQSPPDVSNKTRWRPEGNIYSGNFKSIQLFMRSKLLDESEKISGNWSHDEKVRRSYQFKQYAPFHFEFISKYEHFLGAVNYNISYPGARLNHHYGLAPEYIRVHLCITESPGCIFDIENWRHTWKEGEIFGFDDYNVYHGTNHDSKSHAVRAILMLDIKKSYLKPYAKNWPVRNYRLPKTILLKINPLKGWD